MQLSWRCDHDNDCSDGSDEVGCRVNHTCRSDQFTCSSGQCIAEQYRCDGDMDCADGSDEHTQICSTPTPRTCTSLQFRCQNGNCVANSSLCNYVDDCGDLSDERHCGIDECKTPEDNQCAQLCTNTLNSYVCSCNPGFQLLADGKSCEDINECAIYSLNECNHFCTNLKGSYKCTCATGYQLKPGNHHLCKAINSSVSPRLVFSVRHEIRYIGTDAFHEELGVSNTKNVVSIDYDSQEQRIYWTESDNSPQIRRAFLNGTGIEVIVSSGMVSADGLAVDWVGRNFYFTDAVQDKIFVCSLKGHYRKTLISDGLKEPRALVVDPSEGIVCF